MFIINSPGADSKTVSNRKLNRLGISSLQNVPEMVVDKVSKKFQKIPSSFQETGLCLDCKILLSIGSTKSNLCNKEKSFSA